MSSHKIEQYSYPVTTSKEDIYAELNTKAAGELDSIRWLDTEPLSDKSAAEKFIKENDSGWYDCLAVQYKATVALGKFEDTDTYKHLTAKLGNTVQKLKTLNEKCIFDDVHSQFVSCKSCHSKLAVAYMKSNFCPLCGQDMRNKTVRERVEKYQDTVEKLYTSIEAERQRHRIRKRYKTHHTTAMWLVKIEYHTD